MSDVSPSSPAPAGFFLTRPKRRRAPSRLVVAVGVVVLVGLVAGGVAMAESSSSSSSYRTALVSQQSVNQVLHAVAVVQPVRQASIAFPVSGTVQAVNVSVGDQVTTGEALAALSTDSLNATLASKQATLAQDQLNLQKALEGQNPGLSSALGSGGSNAGGGGGGGSVSTSAAGTATAFNAGPSTPSSAPTSADIQQAQQAVLAAQKQVDTDLSQSQTDLANSSQVCAAVSTQTGSVNPADAAACQQALQTVLTDQQTVAKDQAALSDASNALNTLLDQAANAGSGSTTTTVPSGTSGRGSGGSTGGSSTPSGGSTTKSSGATGSRSATSSAPSAEDLVAYQQAVDAASDQVAVAQQAVAQATIVSPIDGTVEAVNITPNESVSAGSSTENIVVMGQGGYEVTLNVSVTDLPNVKVGQAATVMPDGAGAPVDGKVVSIAVAGTANSTTGDTVYPVIIGLTGNGAGLSNGSTASASIVTSQNTKALAVPTSAVTTLAGRHLVTVLSGGKATVTPITVGAIGQTWTAVLSGVTAGQKVVLATLNQPLPGSATSSSSSSNTNTLAGLVSRLRQGGAGGGAGGFGGGGAVRVGGGG